MSLDVVNLEELDSDAVGLRTETLMGLLSELYPALDLSAGSINRQLLVNINGILSQVNRDEIDRIRRSLSLQTITADPTLADDELVAALLSNYFVTRVPAAAAQGRIAVVISAEASTTISENTVFTCGSRTFKPTMTYTALLNSALVTRDGDTDLCSTGTNYWFEITVVEGVEGGTTLAAGTQFLVDPEPSNFVSCYAIDAFSAGTPETTNADMVNQLSAGLSVKALSSRGSDESLLKSRFATIRDMSIVGFGDVEMSRDKHNIFAGSHGGKADVYVRTVAYPQTTKITVASRISGVYDLKGSERAWDVREQDVGDIVVSCRFSLPATVVPGFYRIEKVTALDPTSTTTREIEFEEVGDRGVYTPPDDRFVPVINHCYEARYTKYQGPVSILISDNEDQIDHAARIIEAAGGKTPDELGCLYFVNGVQVTEVPAMEDTADTQLETMLRYGGFRFYDIYVSHMPEIADIQDYINTRSVQAPGADYLVKAPIPCLLSMDVTIGYLSSNDAPQEETIKTAIVNAVNGLSFNTPYLSGNTIMLAVSRAFGCDDNLAHVRLPIAIRGTLLWIDGTEVQLTGNDSALELDEQRATDGYSTFVHTRRTIALCLAAEHINVTYEPLEYVGA